LWGKLRTELLEKLSRIVGERWVVSDQKVIEAYLYDRTEKSVTPVPSTDVIVVKPATVEEVSEIVELANRESVPIFPRGGGTGLAGGAVPTKPGIVISMERMNRIFVDRENMVAEVEAGATLGKLIEESEKVGLYFPPHPGDEGAQIGGLIACNAGGSRALRHGTMRNYVLGLQVVLPDGTIANIGGKTLKNNMATNFSHLFIGSEGTLGIIVKAVIRLYPKPKHSATLLFPFSNAYDAADSAMKLLWEGFLPLSLELVDAQSMRAAAEYLGMDWKYGEGEAYLIVTISEPNKDMLYAEMAAISDLVSDKLSGEPIVAESKAEQDEILKIRGEIYSAYERNLFEGLDVSVPLGEVKKFIGTIQSIGERYGIRFPIIAHLGDGTFHPDIMHDSLDEKTLLKIREEIYDSVVAMGGSITGEHGIGYTRRPYAEKYLDGGLKKMMRAVKKALDGKGIMNPDKFIP